MKNTFGSAVTLTIWGESHGAAIGAVLDGICAGIPVDEAEIARWMDKRRAKADGMSTARKEADQVRFLSGVYNGFTTGTPISLMIENTNTRSKDYGEGVGPARPGHADWAAHQKYLGYEDFRGGGHFSGRITAALVAAGALCGQILAAKGVHLATHLAKCAGIGDMPFARDGITLENQVKTLDASQGLPVLDEDIAEKIQAAVRAAAGEGDSVGGVLETAVIGLPGGVGEPFFDSVESVLSHLLFSIPAVKGVEFGAGFGFADLKGSAANDPLALEGGKIVTATNQNGGVNGGIANGMPLVLRSCVKPTPSIYKPQSTVNLTTGEETGLQIKGRHDPCILHRAAIVQTAAVALGLLDLCTQRFGALWQKEGF